MGGFGTELFKRSRGGGGVGEGGRQGGWKYKGKRGKRRKTVKQGGMGGDGRFGVGGRGSGGLGCSGGVEGGEREMRTDWVDKEKGGVKGRKEMEGVFRRRV
uniref:Uncharacterized protein n=1 Tax=Knipowitschia caucasica TaxID=637954 RepID=A0AAV2KTX9_KNICA